MAAVPMKPEYGPTLGRLLAPRWHGARRSVRIAIMLAGAVVVAAVIGVALTLLDTHYSQGGQVPFSFSYKGLYRTTPDPGGYVKLHALEADGSLKDSFAVEPLMLPPYTGGLSGELPVYATGYARELERQDEHFVLHGEGKTRVNKVPGYEILYTTRIDGREFFGRNVLLLPEKPGVRRGVKIVMLTSATATSKVKGPSEVASEGVLVKPLKTFTFG
jgi:hypothetical protein